MEWGVGQATVQGGHKRAGHDLVTKQQQQICIYRNLRCQNIKNTENSTWLIGRGLSWGCWERPSEDAQVGRRKASRDREARERDLNIQLCLWCLRSGRELKMLKLSFKVSFCLLTKKGQLSLNIHIKLWGRRSVCLTFSAGHFLLGSRDCLDHPCTHYRFWCETCSPKMEGSWFIPCL